MNVDLQLQISRSFWINEAI